MHQVYFLCTSENHLHPYRTKILKCTTTHNQHPPWPPPPPILTGRVRPAPAPTPTSWASTASHVLNSLPKAPGNCCHACTHSSGQRQRQAHLVHPSWLRSITPLDTIIVIKNVGMPCGIVSAIARRTRCPANEQHPQGGHCHPPPLRDH